MKIRKIRPRLIIEAVQVDAMDYDGLCEIIRWCGGRAIDHADGDVIEVPANEDDELPTYAGDGDWVIGGHAGRFFTCRADNFADRYVFDS